MKKRKILLYSLLSISLTINILVFSLDTIPYVWPKVKSKYFPERTIVSVNTDTEKIIIERGLQMISSSKPQMVWDDPRGFTETLLNMSKTTNSKEFRLNNYPRAFLFYGLADYFSKINDSDNLDKLKNLFDKLIFENNKNVLINRIDQVPFGLTSLILYDVYKEEKYLYYSEKLYEYTIGSIENDGLISYRKGQEVILNDVLGMTVPFLIKYDDYIEADLKYIIRQQLAFYIEHGIDQDTYIPVHAIQRENKIKLGSANWGRGIGWYAIALSQWYKETGEFEKEYFGLMESFKKIQSSENLWGQFPGRSDGFDASTTTMFLYSLALNFNDSINKNDVLNSIKHYISSDGTILHTSGDTYSANYYSRSFGKSELSQGMLLLLLSELYK
ncbi:MAG TPA: hypothetical protein GX708_03020 [Gallicola sp.]|nr:hypothetical protein [Gallicola sp.]